MSKELSSNGAQVGVATGRTLVDLTRSAGEFVDRASALARDAGPGGVLVCGTTAELARGRYTFEQRGTVFLVGELLRRDLGAPTPFVGRDAELAAALTAYERCLDHEAPTVVSVSGPPGIGKSRLAREFMSRVAARPSAPPVHLVRCESFGSGQALGVAADLIRAVSGLPKGVDFDRARNAVESRKVPREDSALLASLLANQPFSEGTDPRGARDSLYVSMTELVRDLARDEPVLFVLEDAQWSDPESVAWIDHIAGRLDSSPLFALLLVRPAFWREHPKRFVDRDHVRIDLRPMSRVATRDIARLTLGRPASEELLDLVAQQAAGSPLFAEELSRVIAAGKDVTKAPTIEAAIQVSLDALDDASREAIIVASVLGVTVWTAAVAELGVTDAEASMRRLVTAEMLVEQRASRFPASAEYLFKHALVRDVAYASASAERKTELHALTARWLASMGEDAATVAYHFDLGSLHVEAADCWEAAARRALATNSLNDAVRMADRALVFAEDPRTSFARAALLDEAYSRLDARASERESAVRSMAENVYDEASRLRAMGAQARFDDARAIDAQDVEERLMLVRDQAAALDHVEEEARCSATLAQRRAFAGQLGLAESDAAHLLDLANRRGLVTAAVDAWQALAVVRQTRGELDAALEARRNAARAAKAAGLQEREAMLTVNLGFALTTIGAKAEALVEIESGLAKAASIGSAGAVRHGRMNLLGWAATFGSEARIEPDLAEPRASADEAAGSAWIVRDRVTLGVLFYRGCELLRRDATQRPRARSLLRTAAEAYRTTKNRDVLPVALGFWAEAERRSGDADSARAIAQEAAELLESGAPSLLNEAPVYLALHDACVDVGDLQAARSAMARAIAPLMRRVRGLQGTRYVRHFLVELEHNAKLINAAEAYGLLPPELEGVLGAR